MDFQLLALLGYISLALECVCVCVCVCVHVGLCVCVVPGIKLKTQHMPGKLSTMSYTPGTRILSSEGHYCSC